MYERLFALPVRRRPGSKGRVWALAEELDVWKSKTQPAAEPPVDAPSPAANRGGETPRVGSTVKRLLPLAAMLVLVIGAVWASLTTSGPVTDFNVQGRNLVALDRKGRVLWRHTFLLELNEGGYQEPYRGSHSWIGRFHSQGDPHFIFSAQFWKHESIGDPVFCFDNKGNVMWRFEPGRAVVDGTGDAMVPPYWSSSLQVIIGRSPAETRIVASSNHYLGQADQVAVLDTRGRVLAEYWHPGHILHMDQADLDRSGRNKLLLGGVNNGDHQATLVVLDPLKMSGVVTPKQMKDHRFELLGMAPANEEAVVLFPRSCISVGQPYTRVSDVRVNASGKRIITAVAEGIAEADPGFIYELDYDLHVVSVVPNQVVAVQQAHHTLEQQGKLDHPFDLEKECARLKSEVVVKRPTQ